MAPQPYLGICVIFRDNLDTLPKLLASIEGCADFYSFTDTGSVDGSRALVEDFLSRNAGRLTDFVWVDDFAAARNFCFDQCPARWLAFLDTDDELINPQKVRQLLINTESRQPQVEAFFLKYDYGHLEELPTLRLVRWSNKWRWADAIHERLEHTPLLPDEAFAQTQEFHVRHKNKTDEEKRNAVKRNAVIARREFNASTDLKYRARLARTIAMELKMDGKPDETIELLKETYLNYRSFQEGRQAAADIAKAYQFIADVRAKTPEERRAALLSGLEWAKKAGPAYEALIHHALGNKPEVLKAVQRSLGRGQQATHEGYIFEQGLTYVEAADAVMDMKLPHAADIADHLLGYIPSDIKTDSAVTPMVNTLRARIDRITIVVPGTPQPFDENGGGGMLGGSEEAVMYLTRELAKQGRNVRVFCVLPPHRLPGPDKYGVDWQPATTFNPDAEHGTLVLWRAPQMLLKLMEEAGRRNKPLSGVCQAFLWLHDSGLGLPVNAANIIGSGVNAAVVLSDFHGEMIRRSGYTGQLVKLANGVVEEDFEPFINSPLFGIHRKGRDPFKVVYSSCPSRGLMQLLAMWPAVKEAVPEATLDVYYDWSMLEAMQPRKYEEICAAYDKVKHLGVIHHGGVDHATLHAALRKANVWAYSHFESPEVETFCISAVKALAAGASVLTVPNGALAEVTDGDAHMYDDVDSYRDALIRLLKAPESVSARRERARRALSRYGWKPVAKGFSDLWTLQGKFRPAPLVEAPSAATVVG